MGDVKDLSSKEAIEKLQELATDADICMFVTNLSHAPFSARPMSTQEVDEAGNIWFMSREGSEKNTDIEMDNHVQLYYSNNKSSEYLSVYGEAAIIRDRKKIEELWTPIAKTWFNEGKDDPEITLIKITPLDAYYWDTKNNKMVSLVKILAGAIVGKEFDGGIEGKIKV